jgi:hypothetical protein
MSIYSLGFRIPAAPAVWTDVPAVEIYSVGRRGFKILEIGIIINGASTNNTFGLGIPATSGVGPILPYQFQQEENFYDPPSQVYAALDWTTPPTVSTDFYVRDGQYGGGSLHTFIKGLFIPIGSSFGFFYTLSNTKESDVWVIIDE